MYTALVILVIVSVIRSSVLPSHFVCTLFGRTGSTQSIVCAEELWHDSSENKAVQSFLYFPCGDLHWLSISWQIAATLSHSHQYFGHLCFNLFVVLLLNYKDCCTERINHMTHYEGLQMIRRSAPCALIAAQRHSYCSNIFQRQVKGVILDLRTLMVPKTRCVCVCVEV